MVNDTTSDLFVSTPTGALDEQQAKLEAAYQQAMAQYVTAQTTATAKASAAAALDDGKPYSQHEVPGLGRYIIPRRTGWQFLLDIIHDPVPNIDFSANIYPEFDGILGDHFQSPYLLDPLDNKYESYESLRDNLAAVRNFLMERYFAVDSTIAPVQGKQNMAEIAAFVGDGLYNNFIFAHLIPNHDPDKPHIDITRARAENGEGAQYIYDCILAHNRHAGGFRPFDAVIEFFGGKKAADWKLPDSDKTHFTETLHHELAVKPVSANPELAEMNAAVAGSVAALDAIHARLNAVHDAKLLSNNAVDLENIGNNLIFTATHMEGVAHLDEPVRRNAVEIAKDILKKLKVSLGEVNVMDGLKMKPSEDMSVFGSIKGVAKVYERLLAWARNNNDAAIFQHPSVLAATQAIAQIGYLAKQEAMRMATLAGDTVMASNISEQLKLLPSSFVPKPGTKFGELLDTVQSGMETIINRTQQVVVDGGQIGHSLDGNRGGVSSIPVAGIGSQTGVYNAAQRNQQAMLADDLAAQAQAQRITAQVAHAKQGQPSQSQATPSRSSTGRQSLGTAKAAAKAAATVSAARVSSTAPLTAAQQQAALRGSTSAALAARRMSALGHHEDHEHEEEMMLRAQQAARLAAAATAKTKATAAKIDLSTLKGLSMKGVTGAPITPGRDISPQGVLAKRTIPGVTTQTVKTQSMDGINHSHDHDHAHHEEHPDIPPVQPTTPTRGGGRGY